MSCWLPETSSIGFCSNYEELKMFVENGGITILLKCLWAKTMLIFFVESARAEK